MAVWWMSCTKGVSVGYLPPQLVCYVASCVRKIYLSLSPYHLQQGRKLRPEILRAGELAAALSREWALHLIWTAQESWP